jgi:hypothetical protein
MVFRAVFKRLSEEGAKLTGTRTRFHSGFLALICGFSVLVINLIIDSCNNEARTSYADN